MNTPTSLALVAFAVLGAGCSSTPDPSTSSVPETSTTTAASAELDAWRRCIIDRVGRINSEVNEEIEEVDVRLEELSRTLADLSEQLRTLDSQRAYYEDEFDAGTEALNAVGLPGTTEQVRKDPDIAAVLRKNAGSPQQADAMASLSSAQLDTLGTVLKRENDLGFQLGPITNEMHDVEKLQGELGFERFGLGRRRRELVAEREDTMTTLQAALESQQSGDIDWSLCTGS